MKKILSVLSIIILSVSSSYSQTSLSYSNYYQASVYTFTSYTTTPVTSDPNFNNDWVTSPAGGACWGTPGAFYTPSCVSMSSPGVIKLTEINTVGTPTPSSCGVGVYNYAGIITSKNYVYGCGILEASIQISNDPSTSDPVGSAFWTNPGGAIDLNELDIIDVSESNYIVNTLYDGFYTPRHRQSYCPTPSSVSPSVFPIGSKLSNGFHLYSCLWDPTGISYYLDDIFLETIPYSTVRNYPGSYTFSIGLVALGSASTSGISMYVNAVTLWRPKCNPGTADITLICNVNTSSGGLTTDVIKAGLFKYATINLGDLITTNGILGIPTYPYIFEAESTTIMPNFLEDQSSLQSAIVALGSCSSSANTLQNSNGYLLILPTSCSNAVGDNSDYRNASPGGNAQNGILANAFNKRTLTGDTSNSLGINNANGYTQIQVYPNPTQSSITISYPCTSDGQLEIKISDVAGQVRYTESVVCGGGSNVQQIIDMTSFSPGVYFIDLTLNDQHTVKKIVKM